MGHPGDPGRPGRRPRHAWESSLGTNPLHADSDRDGIGDALEAATGTDPLLPADDPEDRPDHPEP
jgi:Bacterial TSP3 repeat